MYEDGKRALFPPAMATFVVATALFDFIEVCGLFLVGPTDSNGEETSSSVRFHSFFDYLGSEYEQLRKNNPEVKFYNELRCGMSHQGLIKNRDFFILGSHKEVDDETLRNGYIAAHILLEPSIQQVTCGVTFNGTWGVVVGKLLIDFQDAVQRFVTSIENGNGNRENFFAAADHIGLSRFKVES